MKNIFKFGLFALFLSMAACSDATDIIQESELGEEAAFQTVGDLQSGLNGAYRAYIPDGGGNGNGDSILWNDLFTDNMTSGPQNAGQGVTEYNFILQPATNNAISIWGNRYACINRVNRVLSVFDRIYETIPTFEDASPADRAEGETRRDADQVKAQLLALRALCHFDLFQYYTPDYDNPAGLSVIKVDFVPNITDVFERNTVAEILEFIHDDIDQAYALIGDRNAGNVSYINEDVIMAIEARVSIFTGLNARAEELATELISRYPLSQPDAYEAMFRDESNGEIIWKLERLPTNDQRIASLYYANSVSATGSAFFGASRQLYELYDEEDVRRGVNILEQGVSGGDPANGLFLIAKYPGVAQNLLVNDVKVFRSSEMMLILAEAQARLGNLTGAEASIVALRTARYAPSVPPGVSFANLNQALNVILVERRKELAFEGHRYLDLKRIGGELGIGIDRLDSDAATFSAPSELPANDYRFTLPIPQSELNANNIITQNPGYPEN